MFKIVACSALLAVLASTASAASYQTIVNFTPTGGFGTSTDPADGNQIVLDWDTALTSGIVGEGDLTDLTFSLFGTGGLIFTDMAIVGGTVQPIGGATRALTDISFVFDLDIAPGGARAGLTQFINDLTLSINPAASGITYALLGNFVSDPLFVQAARYDDGVLDFPKTVIEFVAPVPLPPAGLALFAGITALIGLGRKRRAT